MQSISLSIRPTRLCCLIVFFLFVGSGRPFAASVQVVFSLTPPAVDENRFGVMGELNTLASGVGSLTATGQVELSGEIPMTLDLDLGGRGGVPIASSITLGAAELKQTPLALAYSVGPTLVQFSTTEIESTMASLTADGPIPVEFGRFQADMVELVHNGGTANVSVPVRGLELQDLEDDPIVGQFPVQQVLREGVIQFAPTAVPNQFEAELLLPLDGQMLRFMGVGLPLDLEFTGGQSQMLRATTTFSVIPEPATGALVGAVAAGLFVARLSRKRLRTDG